MDFGHTPPYTPIHCSAPPPVWQGYLEEWSFTNLRLGVSEKSVGHHIMLTNDPVDLDKCLKRVDGAGPIRRRIIEEPGHYLAPQTQA